MRIGKGFSRRGRIRNGRNYRADFENHPLFEQHATFPYNFLSLPSLLCTQRGLTRGRLANDANYRFELFCLRSDREYENWVRCFNNEEIEVEFCSLLLVIFLILYELYCAYYCIVNVWKKEEIPFIFPFLKIITFNTRF